MENYDHKDAANMLSLLLVGALVATMLPNTVLGAQTTSEKPNLQAQISNASSAKNTNATACYRRLTIRKEKIKIY